MNFPPALDRETLRRYFPPIRPPIKPGAFEIGLCLGGTVSAGAYTGGVLDMLVEALDAWTRAKEDPSSPVPRHEVVISTLAGASGGAINGAILLRAAGREFPHGASEDNPFYAAWTTGVDLMRLLGRGRDERQLISLFNCDPIDDQAEAAIRDHGKPLGTEHSPRQRSYFADPLRLTIMVGNVTGVPYAIPLTGAAGLGHEMVAHADYMRFALRIGGGVPAEPRERPDELPLSSDAPENWDMIGKAALATSAFPLAFRSRQLSRAMIQCGYRAIAMPGEAGPGSGEIVQLIPNWRTLMAGEENEEISNFVNVDGGTINNEPLDMVRIGLAGLDGRNQRDPRKADRAVILIDPFSDPEALGPRTPPALAGLALPFVLALVGQARYKPADIALAHDEDAYSRFLIAPVRRIEGTGTVAGKAAIASGGLGGFLGFVDTNFLRHDYALGRLNAYRFLRRHLAVPEAADNPVFAGWDADQRNRYRFTEPDARGNPIAYLPLIPLMDTVREPTEPSWPSVSGLPSDLAEAITARLDAVYALATSQAMPDSWWRRAAASAYLWAGWRFYLRGTLRDLAVKTIRQGLIDQKLMPGNR